MLILNIVLILSNVSKILSEHGVGPATCVFDVLHVA